MFVGFKSLDLFGSFGVLSAGDPNAETSIAAFLNDPDVNRKVDYLFIGQGREEADGRLGERCVALHQALLKHEVEHEYYVGGHGGHWCLPSSCVCKNINRASRGDIPGTGP